MLLMFEEKQISVCENMRNVFRQLQVLALNLPVVTQGRKVKEGNESFNSAQRE